MENKEEKQTMWLKWLNFLAFLAVTGYAFYLFAKVIYSRYTYVKLGKPSNCEIRYSRQRRKELRGYGATLG
jgi:hypothetical protein